MAKMLHYALNFDAIEPTIAEFFSDKPDYEYEFVEEKSYMHALKIWKVESGTRCKKPGIVTIYNKQGRYCLVGEGATQLRKVVEDCKDFLIEELRLPDADLRCFVLKGVERELFNAFMDIIRKELTIAEGKSVPTGSHFVVSDNKNSSVHITYYDTGVVRMQGVFTALFMNLITNATKELTGEDGAVIEELLKIGQQKNNRYATEITKLVNNSKPLTDYKLSGSVLASVILANSNNELGDYACYSFGVLKAIEGLLALKLAAHLASDTDSIGNCFEEHPTSHLYHLRATINDFDGNPELKKYIEKAYNTYKNNRHTTFHVRKLNVEASRVLTYEDALDIIDDGLGIINGLCDNW